MPLKVLVAPSGFKECLDADRVAECVARGVRRAAPSAEVAVVPVVDGGEGTARILAELTGGRLVPVRVTGPTGDPLDSHFALLDDRWDGIAVVEMAAAAGLRLVPPDQRNPLLTTSRGVGELVRAALDAGAKRVVVGCGDSGVCDAGAGAAQALGVRLLDADGRELGPGGAELLQLARIDTSGRDERIGRVPVELACNPAVPLCGPDGVMRFAAQKGATADQVRQLGQVVARFADVAARCLGVDLRGLAAGGASGGLGAGLHALLGVPLRSRFEVFLEWVGFDARLAECDLVLTAEGRLDGQTLRGKVPAEVARRAKARGVPVVALAGEIGVGAAANLAAGIEGYATIVRGPCALADAVRDAPTLIEEAAEQAIRLVLVGTRLRAAVE
jgi:glycerate kinase